MKTLLKRTIEHEVVIPLSGSEVAQLFWSLDERGQADFFNHLGTCDLLVFQLQSVTDSGQLKYQGRLAMEHIGEYAAPNPQSDVPSYPPTLSD